MTVLQCTNDLSIDKISENKEMEVKCANKLIVMSNIRDACQRTGMEMRTAITEMKTSKRPKYCWAPWILC